MPDSYYLKGKNYPTPADPPERVCFVIEIPDALEYRAALMGQIEWLADWRCWRHDNIAYTDPPAINREIAALFAQAISTSRFEECMDCDDITDCIETDEGTRGAIISIVQANTEFPADYPYGQDLPMSRRQQDLSTAYNPTCDLDILFAQCYGVVDLTNSEIKQTLQVIELQTNVVELAKAAVSTIPGVAAAEKASGLDGAADLINYYQEAIEEQYEAQWTETPITGTRDVIAFALFCRCKSDCIITIERINEVMNARLAIYTAPPSLAGFINLLEFLTGTAVDETFVVDSAFAVGWAMMATANILFGAVGNNVLDLVVKMKSDEPSNDWELMGECPENFEHPFEFLATDGGWLAFENYAQWSDGIGWIQDDVGIVWIYINIPDSGRKITSVRFITSAGNQIHAQVEQPAGGAGGGEYVVPNAPFTDYTVDLGEVAGFESIITQLSCRIALDGVSSVTGAIEQLIVSGEGSDPFL